MLTACDADRLFQLSMFPSFALTGVIGPSGEPNIAPADRIGVMPNLRAIIERQQLMANLNSRLWVAVVLILFGVIQDGAASLSNQAVGPFQSIRGAP